VLITLLSFFQLTELGVAQEKCAVSSKQRDGFARHEKALNQARMLQ